MIIGSINCSRKETSDSAVFCITNPTRSEAGTNLGLLEKRPAATKRHLKRSYMTDRTALTRPKTSWLQVCVPNRGWGVAWLIQLCLSWVGVHVSWSPCAPFCVTEIQVKTVIFSRMKM